MSLRRLVFAFFLGLAVSQTAAATTDNPLEPTDRSSPRATLISFLENANFGWEAALGDEEADINNALRQRTSLRARRCLDLSQVPPSELEDTSLEAAIMLLDVLNRIPMPDMSDVPDAKLVAEMGLDSWQIPGTAISIAEVTEGEQAGEWLFTSDVVARVPVFYRLTRELPLNPDAVVEDGYQLYTTLGGTLIPDEWVLALPQWAQRTYFHQALWQWFLGVLTLIVTLMLAILIIRFSRPGKAIEETGKTRFILGPLLLMLLSQCSLYFLDSVLNFTGGVLSYLRFLLLFTYYLSAAWLAIRVCVLVGHSFKRNRRFGKESIDEDLVDTLVFFTSIVFAVLVLANGAATIGIPLAGVLTGLGVGGIAVALAAQSTLENLLGGFTLFLDRPIRVGDYCKFGDKEGTVERIGLRSTRIRTLQRTIISVPNSEFSKAHIESLAARDKMLLKEIFYLRMYTSNNQIQLVLDGLRSVLQANVDVDAKSIRVRLVGLGPEALQVEVNAYVRTNNWSQFLEIKEGI